MGVGLGTLLKVNAYSKNQKEKKIHPQSDTTAVILRMVENMQPEMEMLLVSSSTGKSMFTSIAVYKNYY